jgi:hypothetical protein
MTNSTNYDSRNVEVRTLRAVDYFPALREFHHSDFSLFPLFRSQRYSLYRFKDIINCVRQYFRPFPVALVGKVF